MSVWEWLSQSKGIAGIVISVAMNVAFGRAGIEKPTSTIERFYVLLTLKVVNLMVGKMRNIRFSR